jgi:hypothetical protein
MACAAAGSSTARTAMMRSFGVAASPSSASRPAPRSSALLDGLPIMSAALSTPASASSLRETRINATESR